MSERTATAPDGYPVHGWVTTPPGPGPHPVLLTIHGGPFAQYGWALFDETQTYVSAGYAVVQCNPRGSSGYGAAHGRAIRGACGELDAADVLAFLDAALEDPALDADRVGVMGGSYGGYLTALLIGRTTRFAAAISERAFIDPVSFVGSSDIGWCFPDQYLGTDPARVAAQSALAAAHRITTPTLVIHSEEDWRAPLEQGARLYVELKRRGVPSELLLFPGEGHELSRSGRPRHRLARFEHILRWWARWLPTPQNRAGPRSAEPAPVPSSAEPAPVEDHRPSRCRCGSPGSTEEEPSWWSDVCRGGRSCGTWPGRAVSPATRPTGGWPGRPPSATSGRSPVGGCRARSSTTPTAPPGRRSPSGGRGRRSSGWSSGPGVLRDVSAVDPSTTVLGARAALPLAFAPTGFTRLMHTEGEAAVGRVAERVGIPLALSTMGTTSVEALAAAAPGARRWFQLYLWRDRDASAALVARARAAGYEALVLTVDTPVAGPRLRDVRNGFSIPPALTLRTVANAAVHPSWWVDLLTTPPLEFASLRSWAAPSPSWWTGSSSRPRRSPTSGCSGRRGRARWS